MNIVWEDAYSIKVSPDKGGVLISADRGGLLSLARVLEALAEEEPGSHIHLDQYNSLEDGSAELIIEKI